MSLLLAACSGGPQGAGSAQSGAAGEQGALTVGYYDTIADLHPFPLGAGTAVFRLSLFEPLLWTDSLGVPIPVLAESWEFADDGMSLTLNLRQGVVFHDGTPFDADAVLANIALFADPAFGAQGVDIWSAATAVATDDATVVLGFDHPVPEIFSIIDNALITKPGAQGSGIGTGPFVLDDFNPREGITLKANENYWDPDRPGVQHLELREYSDAAALSLAVRTGTVDLVVNLLPDQAASVEDAGLVLGKDQTGLVLNLLINAVAVPDAQVRQALSLAFDRERFVETVLLGHGEPLSSPFPASSPVWNGEVAEITAFDLEAAKALLDEAGVADLTLTVMSSGVLPLDQFMPIYQQDLATIGIELIIEPTDAAVWAQAVAQPGVIPDLATHGYRFSDLDPALVFSAHPFRVGANASGYESAEYEATVAAASAIVDLDDRYAAFRATADFIADEAFVIPVAHPIALRAHHDGVSGFVARAGGYDFSPISVST